MSFTGNKKDKAIEQQMTLFVSSDRITIYNYSGSRETRWSFFLSIQRMVLSSIFLD